jgi:hypothetical protein
MHRYRKWCIGTERKTRKFEDKPLIPSLIENQKYFGTYADGPTDEHDTVVLIHIVLSVRRGRKFTGNYMKCKSHLKTEP